FAELGVGGMLTGWLRRTIPGVIAIAVATPDDLDALVQAIAGATSLQSFAASPNGEHLYVSERMVISPCAGVFQPTAAGDDARPEGEPIEVGAVLGRVAGQQVR